MFAGNIKQNITISATPATKRTAGTNNATPSKISATPVANTNSFLKGTDTGIIITIPRVNLKCPSAVNNNITHIPTFPARIKAQPPQTTRAIPAVSRLTPNKTKRGFIIIFFTKMPHRHPQ